MTIYNGGTGQLGGKHGRGNKNRPRQRTFSLSPGVGIIIHSLARENMVFRSEGNTCRYSIGMGRNYFHSPLLEAVYISSR